MAKAEHEKDVPSFMRNSDEFEVAEIAGSSGIAWKRIGRNRC